MQIIRNTNDVATNPFMHSYAKLAELDLQKSTVAMTSFRKATTKTKYEWNAIESCWVGT